VTVMAMAKPGVRHPGSQLSGTPVVRGSFVQGSVRTRAPSPAMRTDARMARQPRPRTPAPTNANPDAMLRVPVQGARRCSYSRRWSMPRKSPAPIPAITRAVAARSTRFEPSSP